MMEISIINVVEQDGNYLTTFKFWESGKCACTAQKKQVEFDTEPTLSMLMNYISSL